MSLEISRNEYGEFRVFPVWLAKIANGTAQRSCLKAADTLPENERPESEVLRCRRDFPFLRRTRATVA
jgi:hypothetical protein